MLLLKPPTGWGLRCSNEYFIHIRLPLAIWLPWIKVSFVRHGRKGVPFPFSSFSWIYPLSITFQVTRAEINLVKSWVEIRHFYSNIVVSPGVLALLEYMQSMRSGQPYTCSIQHILCGSNRWHCTQCCWNLDRVFTTRFLLSRRKDEVSPLQFLLLNNQSTW